jgi:hypothetical protein
MNGRLISAFIIGAALGTTAMPVLASTCYEVIDRDDVVIYRDRRPPVDLSNAGAPAREAMRNRGELLIILDVTTCAAIGRGVATGGRALTTDEIVAGWRSFAGKGGWGTYSSAYGGSPTLAQPATQTQSSDLSAPGGSR